METPNIFTDGKAPEMRMTDPSQALALYNELESQDFEAARKRALIQGFYDRSAPYSSKKLVESGQADRTNLNFGDMEATIDAHKDAFWELYWELQTLVEVTPAHNEVNAEVCNRYSEAFTNAMMGWEDFYFEIDQHLHWLSGYGYGHMMFPDSKSWVFRHMKAGQVKVSYRSKCRSSSITVMMVDWMYDAHELYELIETPEAIKVSKKAGWDTDLIIRVLEDSLLSNDENESESGNTTETLADMMRGNRLLTSTLSESQIKLVHCYTKEYDGEISHCIFAESNGSDESYETFVFKRKTRFKKWSEIISMYFYSMGRGGYHGVKGIGTRSYNHLVTQNQFMNNLVDMGIDAASVILQYDDPSTATDEWNQNKPVRRGRYMVLPPGAKLNSELTRYNFAGPMNVMRSLQMSIANNIKTPTLVHEEMNAQTDARKANELRFSKGGRAKLNKSTIFNFVRAGDGFWSEVFKRMVVNKLSSSDPGYEVQQAFYKELENVGVDRNLYKLKDFNVRMRRPIGLGSDEDSEERLATLQNLRPAMDTAGRRQLDYDIAASVATHGRARKYIQKLDRDDLPNDHTTLIWLENAAMKQGQTIPVAPDQPHAIHLKWHMQDIEPMVQEAVQGQDMEAIGQVVGYMKAMIPHLQQHTEGLGQDPGLEDMFDEYNQRLAQLVNTFKEMENAMNQYAQQQQAQQQSEQQEAHNQELRKIRAELETEYQTDMIKLQEELKLREADTMSKIQERAIKTQAEIDIGRQKAQNK
jgi:hypothetical protein